MNNILKLLIVDDEKHIRTLLRYSIDWESLGIEIVGEASCAEEGLQLVEELEPSIIFSDICMDYMDGLEFSREVKKNHPYIKIILLSGHDKFDYATQAIELGITAYLLKPIQEEKVIETVEKIKKTIYGERTQQQEFNQLKFYLNENRMSLMESNFNALLFQTIEIASVIKRLSYLDIYFSNSHFQIALIQLTPLQNKDIADEEQLFLYSMECNEIIKSTLKKVKDLYIFFDLNHQSVILSNNDEIDFTDILEQVKSSLSEKLPCYVTIGIGNKVTILSGIRKSYRNAIKASNYGMILGNNQIIHYDFIQVLPNDNELDLESSISMLMESINLEQLDKSLDIVNTIIQTQLTIDSSDIVPIQVTVASITNHLSDMLIQAGLRNTDIFNYSITAHERLFRLNTAFELKNLLQNLIRFVIETVSSTRSKENNSIIISILNYLESHYDDPNLSLTSVAKKFHFNASYLSRLFKLEASTTFTKHLTGIRLKEAALLLSSTTLRSYEISEKVGFRDPKYFSSCFKKYYYITPNEYRISNTN